MPDKIEKLKVKKANKNIDIFFFFAYNEKKGCVIMRNEINIVQLNEAIPLSFSIIQFDEIFAHMHARVQLIIVLDGDFEVHINDNRYLAKENDIFLINPGNIHYFKSVTNSTILSVLIDQNEFLRGDDSNEFIMFNLNSMEMPNDSKYDGIRYLVYSIIKFNSKDNVNNLYNNKAIAYSLFARLVNDFKVDLTESNQRQLNYDTITKITSYINDHYKENLSLTLLSNHFNYSTAYLSRLFKNVLGVNFIDYYDSIRINYSMNDLLLSNKTIETIANEYGFDSSRSYVRAFMNMFRMYPSEYRKKNKENNAQNDLNLSALRKEMLDKILNYYEQYSLANGPHESIRETEELITVDFQIKNGTLHHPQSKTFYFGSIKNLLFDGMMKLIKKVQQDIGFEYLLLDDLIGHEYTIIEETTHGELLINTAILDFLCDSLSTLGLKPYFKFEWNSNMDYSIFEEALCNVLLHIKEHSKCNLLDDIMISVSTKEELSKISKNDLYKFFENTGKTNSMIRNKLNCKIKFGAIDFSKNEIIFSSLFSNYLNYIKKENIKIDFYPIRYFKDYEPEEIIKNKNDLKNFIIYLKNNKLFIENKMYFENVNFTNEKYNLLQDTLYKASFIARNVIDNIKSIGSISFDHPMDQFRYETKSNIFHGGSGFITYNALKKASYHSLVFVSRLNDGLLKKSKNYIITANDSKITILINNYNHYADLYAQKQYYELTEMNRYVCFPKSTNIHFAFSIENIPYAIAKIKTSVISSTSGSSYDICNAIGDLSIMDYEEIEQVKKLSEVKFSILKKVISAGKLDIDAHVSPLEMQLIEIFME